MPKVHIPSPRPPGQACDRLSHGNSLELPAPSGRSGNALPGAPVLIRWVKPPIKSDKIVMTGGWFVIVLPCFTQSTLVLEVINLITFDNLLFWLISLSLSNKNSKVPCSAKAVHCCRVVLTHKPETQALSGFPLPSLSIRFTSVI